MIGVICETRQQFRLWLDENVRCIQSDRDMRGERFDAIVEYGTAYKLKDIDYIRVVARACMKEVPDEGA